VRQAGSSECALTGVASINQLANLVMFEQFAAIRSGKALLHFADKPLIVVDQALYCLDDQSFAFSPLLVREAIELFLQIRTKTDFHEP